MDLRPWQALGMSELSPRLQIRVPWQKFLLFLPSGQVRGTLEVSTLWGGKGPGRIVPALNWESGPGGSELGLPLTLSMLPLPGLLSLFAL